MDLIPNSDMCRKLKAFQVSEMIILRLLSNVHTEVSSEPER